MAVVPEGWHVLCMFLPGCAWLCLVVPGLCLFCACFVPVLAVGVPGAGREGRVPYLGLPSLIRFLRHSARSFFFLFHDHFSRSLSLEPRPRQNVPMSVLACQYLFRML